VGDSLWALTVSAPAETVLPGLSPRLVDLLTQAAAPDRLALVGGAVRDLLRHHLHNDPWTGLPDLDLVVEATPAGSPDAAGIAPTQAAAGSVAGEQVSGSGPSARCLPRRPHEGAGSHDEQQGQPEPHAVAAAHRLSRRLRQLLGPNGVAYYQEHDAYGTVELEVMLPSGALLLDVATARRETYPQPGRNPQVEFSRLEDDLARRDFTINAMALVLRGEGAQHREPSAPAGLLDPYGGRGDLERRQLRFLHPQSVRDDPTRVLRGARYAARMGFDLAWDSRQQLAQTLARWPWPWRPGDPPGGAPPALGTRLRMELELLLEREAWPRGLQTLQRWGALMLLDGTLQADRGWHRRLRWASRLGLPLLPSLLAVVEDPVALAERLQLPHRQHRLLAGFMHLRRRLADLEASGDVDGSGWRTWGADRWSALLEEPGHGAEAVALALATCVGPRRPLLRWWLHWRHLEPTLTAAELIAAGLRPGPELGEQLRQSRRQRLAQERR
jgi:poly(A) polymerase